jgi:hypothetical protein
MNLPANIYTQWYWKVLGALSGSPFGGSIRQAIRIVKEGKFFPCSNLVGDLKQGTPNALA